MRDSNYCGKQYTITASEMSKRRTKMMIQYVYVVCLISSLDLIAQCQCSQSANNQTSEKPNYDVEKQARKLPDDVEPITTYTNLLSDPNQIIGDGMTNAFQYYNDPIEITTPKYDSPPSIELPSNHQPIHQLDVNQSYFPQIEPVPYIPSETFINPPPPIPNTYLKKVTREPVWAHHLAPEVYKLENQYISTFRSIKSSVMGLYYKMQNFLGYVMSLFNTDDASNSLVEGPFEGRGKKKGKKGKFKIKKKFKKFLIPLLIAYKLKFFALIPILIGGLVLLVGSTGMAGFFFALFAAVISLKGGSSH